MTTQYQEQWLNSAAGRATDKDGDASYDCVDVPKDYAESIWASTTWRDVWPQAGNAKDMFWPANPAYVDITPNDASNTAQIPQRGDIIVFAGNSVNPYGHIAVVTGADQNGVDVIQEDTYLQTPMAAGHLAYDNGGTGPCLGWLRPKFDAPAPVPTPAPAPGPATRTVTNDVAWARVAPFADAATAPAYPEGIAKGAALSVVGYVKGEDPYSSGDDAWYKTVSGYYVWANAAGNDLSGLAFLGDMSGNKPAPAPTPTPAPTPAPVPAPTPATPYDFALDFPSIGGITVEKSPADGGNLQIGNFPASPDHAVIHQFGTLGVDTFASTDSQFKKPGTQVSAHFSVSGPHVRQHVSLKDRAYHAASVGNNWVGIESDPAQDAVTIATVRKLIDALQQHYGRELVKIRHRDVPGCSTLCGAAINLDNYVVPFPAPVVPTPAPAPIPAPVPTPVPAPVPVPDPTKDKPVNPVNPKVTAATIVGILLASLIGNVNAITPEMLHFLGPWQSFVTNVLVALAAGTAGYLKSDNRPDA